MTIRTWLAARRHSGRWALLYAMALGAAVFALAMMLTACATPAPPKPLLLVYEGCRGKTEFVEVEFRISQAPSVDCVRLAPEYGVNPLFFALQLPIACALRRAEKALIVLPPLAPVAMIVHELRHVMGEVHAPLLPEPMWCP